jgi:FkbM family methyltransferase
VILRRTNRRSVPGISSFALRAILKRPRNKAFVVRLYGHAFKVIDSLSFYWNFLEIFQRATYRFPALTDPPRILDVGANIGLASVFFIQNYPGCRLTAVEPDPDIFSVLKENLRPYQEADCTCLNLAITAQPGNFRFFQNRADSGRLSLPTKAHHAVTQVKGIPLDDLLTESVDFLKLDIEGSEVEVLASCRNLHRASYLFIEYHSFQGMPQDLEVLLTKLKSAGFRYWLQNHFSPKNAWGFTESVEGMDVLINIFARRERL